MSVLSQLADEGELIEAEQSDELPFRFAIVGRLLKNTNPFRTNILQQISFDSETMDATVDLEHGENFLCLALCKHRIFVMLAQVSLQPIRVDVERMKTALSLVVVACGQL